MAKGTGKGKSGNGGGCGCKPKYANKFGYVNESGTPSTVKCSSPRGEDDSIGLGVCGDWCDEQAPAMRDEVLIEHLRAIVDEVGELKADIAELCDEIAALRESVQTPTWCRFHKDWEPGKPWHHGEPDYMMEDSPPGR